MSAMKKFYENIVEQRDKNVDDLITLINEKGFELEDLYSDNELNDEFEKLIVNIYCCMLLSCSYKD